MQIPLATPAAKALFLIPSLIAVALYFGLAASQYAAYISAERADLKGLQFSARLEPSNAQYQDQLGQLFSWILRLPEAEGAFQKAVTLNPGHVSYWLHLAAAEQALGDLRNQRGALLRAIAVDPKSPYVAWQIASTDFSEGNFRAAFPEFRTALAGDPSFAWDVIARCWAVQPDVNVLLRDALPASPGIYSSFLEFLLAKHDTEPAATVWKQIVQLGQPVRLSEVMDYIRYLIARRQPGQAGMIWRQAAPLCDLRSYQPSQQNLIVNGNFSSNILNGGFDWTYEKRSDVFLEVDPTQPHARFPSLLLAYDSGGLEDSGLHQMIVVDPNTTYHFSAYFKTQTLEGAGGAQFVLQDFYTEQLYFQSDNLKDSADWKPVYGNFKSGAATHLLLLRIKRVPGGAAIRGKLWIASVRLKPAGEENVQ
jgi:hypothetical protein